MPGNLAEHGKGNRVPVKQRGVCRASRLDLGDNLRAEQSRGGLSRLECGSDWSEYFAAIVSRHPHRGDFAGLLVGVQDRGTAHLGASVGEGYRPLCISWKAFEELVSNLDLFVRLLA